MFTYVSVNTICIKVQYSRQKKQTTFSIVYFAQNFIPHRPKAGKKKKKSGLHIHYKTSQTFNYSL